MMATMIQERTLHIQRWRTFLLAEQMVHQAESSAMQEGLEQDRFVGVDPSLVDAWSDAAGRLSASIIPLLVVSQIGDTVHTPDGEMKISEIPDEGKIVSGNYVLTSDGEPVVREYHTAVDGPTDRGSYPVRFEVWCMARGRTIKGSVHATSRKVLT